MGRDVVVWVNIEFGEDILKRRLDLCGFFGGKIDLGKI